MVVYTPRLCSDVAFQPPKVNKAHSIVCRAVVLEEDIQDRKELKEIESQLEAPQKEKPINVGGVILGAGKWINKEGQRMPIPANFGQEPTGRVVEVIARAKSKLEGGKVEMASDKELAKLDLDPEMVETVKNEVVDAPGQIRGILGIVDGDEDEPEDEEGSQE